MRFYKGILAAGLVAAFVGCGGGKADVKGATNPDGTTVKGHGGTVVAEQAKARFDTALNSFAGHEKGNDWNEGACSAVAKQFEEAVDEQASKKFPEASYNAGLAYQRCANDKEAKAHFEKALQADSKFHYARAQLALYQFKSDNNVDAAISSLEQAVEDVNFQNVPALVNLATKPSHLPRL